MMPLGRGSLAGCSGEGLNRLGNCRQARCIRSLVHQRVCFVGVRLSWRPPPPHPVGWPMLAGALKSFLPPSSPAWISDKVNVCRS